MANTKTMTMTNKPKNTFSGVTMTKNLASSAEAKTLKPVYISLVKVIAIALLDFSVKHCQRHNGPRVLTPYLE